MRPTAGEGGEGRAAAGGTEAADAGGREATLAGLSRLASSLPREAQQLTIANFPKHLVDRLDSWEWMIYNENVTFVSCDEAGTLTYTGRGFNAERREVVHPRPSPELPLPLTLTLNP